MTLMDESAMNGLELNGSDAENQNQCVVSVEGYDTSLQRYYANIILEKQFSSCGEIRDVSLFTDEETGLLESSASIFFDGHGADDKALGLNGSYLETYLGVCKLVVVRENYLDYTDGDDDSDDMEEMKEKVKEVEKAKEKEKEKEEEDKDKEYGLSVVGFDDSASERDIKIKLCEHLYSCGEVTDVFVCGQGRSNSVCFALVYIMGRGVADKARKLSNPGGGNIKVGFVCPAQGEGLTSFSHQFRGCDVDGCNTKATVVPPQEDELELDVWRFRLPESTRLDLVTVNCDGDGELVVQCLRLKITEEI